jgi:hypothetical protein
MRLEALQNALDGYGLLTENDEDKFGAHPTNGVDSRPKGNDLALLFCTGVSKGIPSNGSHTNSQNQTP